MGVHNCPLNMKVLLMIAASIVAIMGLATVEEIEVQSFVVCNTDGTPGLSWAEVELCEDNFGAMLTALNITIPSEDDFNAADLNGDGVLMLEEWENANGNGAAV